jgi:hypothetical protein
VRPDEGNRRRSYGPRVSFHARHHTPGLGHCLSQA